MDTQSFFHLKSPLMHALIVVFALVAMPQYVTAQHSDEVAIRALLNNQSEAWNKGDIEDFMKGYWENDSLIFIGKNGAKYGYNTTLANYKKGYPDTTAMGKLRFDLLHIKRLSSNFYFVIGKWHLKRTIGDLQGSFTLLLEKIKGQWVIVADHSS